MTDKAGKTRSGFPWDLFSGQCVRVSTMFEKFKEYIQAVCEGGRDTDDITDYFKHKSELLWYSLTFFTEKMETLDPAGCLNDTRTVLLSDFKKDTLSEEKLIEIFQEFLGNDYQTPRDNLHKLQHHLYALWIFYTFIRPNGIWLETLLKLDLAAYELGIVTSSFGTVIPNLIKEHDANLGRKRGNINQRIKGKNNILEAYRRFCKKYKVKIARDAAGEYVFFVDDEKVSASSFATDIIAEMPRNDRLTQKIVKARLFELIDEGKFNFLEI